MRGTTGRGNSKIHGIDVKKQGCPMVKYSPHPPSGGKLPGANCFAPSFCAFRQVTSLCQTL